MTQVIELIDKDIKRYYNNITHVPHGRLKHKHAMERYGKHKQDEEYNV